MQCFRLFVKLVVVAITCSLVFFYGFSDHQSTTATTTTTTTMMTMMTMMMNDESQSSHTAIKCDGYRRPDTSLTHLLYKYCTKKYISSRKTLVSSKTCQEKPFSSINYTCSHPPVYSILSLTEQNKSISAEEKICEDSCTLLSQAKSGAHTPPVAM